VKPKLSISNVIAISELLSAHAPRMRDKSPIFVKPKLSISNVIAISEHEVTAMKSSISSLVTTHCPYCHELVLKLKGIAEGTYKTKLRT